MFFFFSPPPEYALLLEVIFSYENVRKYSINQIVATPQRPYRLCYHAFLLTTRNPYAFTLYKKLAFLFNMLTHTWIYSHARWWSISPSRSQNLCYTFSDGLCLQSKITTVRSKSTNRVLIHYCDTKKPHYFSLHLWFSTPIYDIVLPENQAMFWASLGPAPQSPLPGTAISFLFLPFIFLPSSPRLAATTPAGNCLSRNHGARFCRFVTE